MKLESQVCTLEKAKRLKGLGVSQESYFLYGEEACRIVEGWSVEGYEDNFYAVFTAAELGLMLPVRVLNEGEDYFPFIHKGRGGWYIQYQTNKKEVIVNAEGEIDRSRGYLFNTYRVEYNMAESFASYLILLIESKAIEVTEVNERLTAA